MKKISQFFLLFLILGTLFNACSTKVDLYTNYKEITVIYGLLDSKSDTNFIRINKAFLGPGDAKEISLIDDSCNYPGKLDARIIEYRAAGMSNNYVQTRVLPLDTMTIDNKEPGVFYSPMQKIYYTKERIHNNTEQFRYKYDLEVDRGDTVIRSSTNMVGSSTFTVANSSLNFENSDKTGEVSWFYCPNAAIYEVTFTFYFTEHYASGKTEERSISWKCGTYPTTSLTMSNGKYKVAYSKKSLITELKEYLERTTLHDQSIVRRTIADYPLKVTIAAGGDDLYNFITVNGPSSSLVQNINEYTNIVGGYGVFSSRTLIEKQIKVGNTLTELRKFEDWRFEQG